MSSPLYDLFATVVRQGHVPESESGLDPVGNALLDRIFLDADVFVTTNVTEYYFAGTDQEFWRLDKHFPNLAPVANSFWIETKAPTHIRSAVHGIQPWECDNSRYYQRPLRWGAWFINVADSDLQYFHEDLRTLHEQRGISQSVDDCWTYAISLFTQHEDGRIMEPMWTLGMLVDKSTGQLIRNPRATTGDPFLFVSKPCASAETAVNTLRAMYGDAPLMALDGDDGKVRNLNAKQIYEQEAVALMKPLLLALSFLHCKNVVRTPVYPSPKLNKKRMARNLPPLNKFHTLEIGPMRRIIQQAIDHYRGVKGASGIEMALHSVRGHFKTYTPEKPLLGHAVGTYFWPRHVAGSASRGTVRKRFEVTP